LEHDCWYDSSETAASFDALCAALIAYMDPTLSEIFATKLMFCFLRWEI
jgi:hypothetical protein